MNNLVNLSDLELNLENNLIYDIELEMDNLMNLSDLELNLKDNYIDNVRFEE